MKNYILLTFFLLVSMSAYSQIQIDKNYQLGYRLEYLSDSTDINSRKKEDFTLLVEGGKSYFTSDIFLKRDSIVNSMKINKNLELNFSKVPNTRFKYVIVKEDNTINYYESLLKYKFNYTELSNFNWKLLSEKSKIGDFNCQKAITNYGGRTWIAWYTTEIPIYDGPYKFNNLPGLIVKVSDTKNNYSFDLISIKKGILFENTILKDSYFTQHKKISKEEYFKAVNNINENIINEMSMSGFTVAPESVDRVKTNMKKRNNPIEFK
ncbi:GLPGLI family protein [Chryseobacterium manosquense]|uniref:GLPGLI family protein n=3 Tax=Chryseobacterium group TaxID=2782232 RepID=A0A246BC92_9FLAO|nr:MULTISPECIES: GLPGLI family protein [Chryseobacterium group]OWK99292.1 hypothetical protein AP75_02050 [Kaistella haifensis DSM 19056]QNS42564.1 GLPGLI family protein [Chryseobacterium manosquense]ROI12303.1 GLPGLI family protein [Kaistella haifensis]HCO21048.1 GLPGLI family protein [Flavobacteriaceae bacterium]